MHPDRRRAGRAIRKHRRSDRAGQAYRAFIRRAHERAARAFREAWERALAVALYGEVAADVEWRQTAPTSLVERAKSMDDYANGRTPDAR